MLVCVKAMTRVFWIISKIVHCRKSENIINFYIGYCSEKEKPEFQHMCLKTYFSLVVDFVTIQREKYSINELERGASYAQILC